MTPITGQTPDQSATLTRTGPLGDNTTETLHLNHYGDLLTITTTSVTLDNGTTATGHVTSTQYINAFVAAANYRAMLVILRDRDGWTITRNDDHRRHSSTPLTIGSN